MCGVLRGCVAGGRGGCVAGPRGDDACVGCGGGVNIGFGGRRIRGGGEDGYNGAARTPLASACGVVWRRVDVCDGVHAGVVDAPPTRG